MILNSFYLQVLIVTQWICHCVQQLIDSVVVFVWALVFGLVLVLFCCLPCFRWRNTSLAGPSLFVWLWFSLFWFNRSADFKDFVSLYRVLAAYSHVRTEPLARHRPHSRKKKGGFGVGCWGYHRSLFGRKGYEHVRTPQSQHSIFTMFFHGASVLFG